MFAFILSVRNSKSWLEGMVEYIFSHFTDEEADVYWKLIQTNLDPVQLCRSLACSLCSTLYFHPKLLFLSFVVNLIEGHRKFTLIPENILNNVLGIAQRTLFYDLHDLWTVCWPLVTWWTWISVFQMGTKRTWVGHLSLPRNHICIFLWVSPAHSFLASHSLRILILLQWIWALIKG